MHPTPSPCQPRRARTNACIAALLLCLVVAACGESKQAPAERAIAEIDAALAAAGSAPAKYVPGELKDVQSSLAALKQDFERRDYDAVLEAAPAVLTAARSLAPSAAAREAELLEDLRAEWTGLAQAVPAELADVAARFDAIAARKKLPAGVTAAELRAAKSRLRDGLALWDRARQEATAGRLPEAVTLAHQVRELGRTVDAVSRRAGAADAPVK